MDKKQPPAGGEEKTTGINIPSSFYDWIILELSPTIKSITNSSPFYRSY
jgi:hypothetical protein